jgi:hypothetical protein
MTKRLPATPAPGPLEDYAARFDELFTTLAQRQAFRRYLEGLLLPAERNGSSSISWAAQRFRFEQGLVKTWGEKAAPLNAGSRSQRCR